MSDEQEVNQENEEVAVASEETAQPKEEAAQAPAAEETLFPPQKSLKTHSQNERSDQLKLYMTCRLLFLLY